MTRWLAEWRDKGWPIQLLAVSLVALLLQAAVVPESFAQEAPVTRSLSEGAEPHERVEYIEGEVIIRFRESVSEQRRDAFRRDLDVRESREIGQTGFEHVRMDPERAHRMIEQGIIPSDLEVFQPNYIYRMIEPVEVDEDTSQELDLQQSDGDIPNDPEFFRQWGLFNEGQLFRGNLRGSEGADIDAVRAWAISTGSEDVIIAMFDTGIDYNHPDLTDNLFRDSEGRPGVDCSPSGMVAPGVCGDDPMDENGHGTHVAGIIGARGDNGIGVAGINWNVQLMAVKVFSEDPGSGSQVTSTSSLMAGFEYALQNGARVSNHSYGARRTDGLTEGDQVIKEQIRLAGLQGHLVVAAAGNEGSNNDEVPVYPASYDLDNVISVAASNFDDQLAVFSNYGPNTVHIAAPGHHIYSTYSPHPDGYHYNSGTSMASPHVAGVAGLVWSVFPTYDYSEVRELLLEEGDRLSSLEMRIMGARRLNALQSLPSAGLDVVHGLTGRDSATLRIEVNGEPVLGGLSFSEQSERVRVPAGRDITISIYEDGDVPGLEPIHEETIQFTVDENYYVVIGNREGDSGEVLELHSHRIDGAEVDERDVRLVVLNTVDGLESAGIFGFFPDDRPPFVVAEQLMYGSFLNDYRMRPNRVEFDLTSGELLLESFSIPLADDGGETVLVVATGQSGEGQQEMILSHSAGMGTVAERVTSPGREARHVPDRFVLEDNFPNPFYPRTQIQFNLPEERHVRVDVYDVLGRRIRTLLDEIRQDGIHRIEFDASGLASGVYFFRVQAGEEQDDGKMMLVR